MGVLLTGCADTQKLSETNEMTSTPSESTAEIIAETAETGKAVQAEQMRSINVYRGIKTAPGNLLFTLSEQAALDTISKAMEHAERQPGICDMPSPDYQLDVKYDTVSNMVLLWLWEDGAHIMYAEDSGTLYKVKTENAQQIYDLFELQEPISVFEGDSDIAINHVTESEKIQLIKQTLDMADWKQDDANRVSHGGSYLFVYLGVTSVVRVENGVYTVIQNGRHTEIENEVAFGEALGIRRLRDDGIPFGNAHVRRYCGYIYYTSGGTLSRMRENGTGYETVLSGDTYELVQRNAVLLIRFCEYVIPYRNRRANFSYTL